MGFSDSRLLLGSPDAFGWDVHDIINRNEKTYAIEVVLRSVSWSSFLLGDNGAVVDRDGPNGEQLRAHRTQRTQTAAGSLTATAPAGHRHSYSCRSASIGSSRDARRAG